MSTEPPILRSPGTTLHRQVFLVLRDAIERGAYPPGSALPTEEALVEQFGVARITVRRALADLQTQGLVLRRHGRGTFVRDDLLPARKDLPTLGFMDELRRTAQTTDVSVVAFETVVPPPWVSALLQTPAAEPAAHAIRLRSARGVPVMLTDAWIPKALSAGITAASLERRALYELLMDSGAQFARVLQQISADAADPTMAKLLQCEMSSPLIRLTRLIHDRDGKPVQFMTTHLPPRRSRILMDIPADAIDTLSGGRIVHDVGTDAT